MSAIELSQSVTHESQQNLLLFRILSPLERNFQFNYENFFVNKLERFSSRISKPNEQFLI